MAHIYPARVADISLTTGSGPFSVSGLAPAENMRTFNEVMQLGDTIYLGVAHREKDEWEEGLYTYVSTNRFIRTQIYQSSAGGANVNFTAGIKDVWTTIPSRIVEQADQITGLPKGGTAKVDFGIDAALASVDIVDQFSITANSLVMAALTAKATENHPIEDHYAINVPTIVAGNIVPGTGFTIYATVTPPSEDVATTAWITEVEIAGGSVGQDRRDLVNNFIRGLREDGIWSKFDRIWLLAAENQQSARIDLKVGTLATSVGSPTFTANIGYTCTTSAYLDTNYNFITDAVAFSQNSAHLSCWNLTDGVNADPQVTNLAFLCKIWPKKSADNKTYFNINDLSAGFTAPPDVRGLLLGNRSGANTREAYQNGVSLFTYGSISSNAPTSSTLQIYTRQTAAVSVGGSLSQVEQLAFYNRLNTYMTGVGVSTTGIPEPPLGLTGKYSVAWIWR